ncbi:hypothetical protein ACFDR9_005668 [Janthinobacterium sp. CG_23.3]|uniref:hypothetical protein n=1 Tax=unclassified Janthinobacterium TaxID=2610881 RepID=UPI00034807B5|nr:MULTISPECIES: hypothetical protein [unclassified Janthinobacterium]MEC5159553.1 hypothetical protein [Janthinobacterium sp. CG_S6]
MTRALWYLRRWLVQAGPARLASVALLLGAALLHWAVTLPGAAALAEEQQRHRQAQAATARAHASDAGRAAEQAQVAGLLARFPAGGNEALGAAVIQVQAAADARRLLIDKGSYQFGADAGHGVERYNFSLPVKGAYPAVRGFVRQVQRELPHVALDSASISRAGRADAAVEAQLQFSAYFRSAR